MELSVLAIGRNESCRLSGLVESVQCLRAHIECETIFVDSASTDDSRFVASGLFDTTVVLEESPLLSASAGRHVGVSYCRGDWILFLDGDMELLPSFVARIVSHIRRGENRVGLVGTYVHRFHDGEVRRWAPEGNRAGMVSRFGGAVLLHRQMLAAENWDPRLFSNEEVDLYTRLRVLGFYVRGAEEDFVVHRTELVPFSRRLLGSFLPAGSYLGRKFYGMGQLVAARISSGRLLEFVCWFPAPFLLWGSMILFLILAVFGYSVIGVFQLIFVSGLICFKYSVRSLVYFLALLPQTLFGLGKFKKNWLPVVREVIRR